MPGLAHVAQVGGSWGQLGVLQPLKGGAGGRCWVVRHTGAPQHHWVPAPGGSRGSRWLCWKLGLRVVEVTGCCALRIGDGSLGKLCGVRRDRAGVALEGAPWGLGDRPGGAIPLLGLSPFEHFTTTCRTQCRTVLNYAGFAHYLLQVHGFHPSIPWV